jgi:hypothetical protein
MDEDGGEGKKMAWVRVEENRRVDGEGNGGSVQMRVEMEG